MIVKTKAATTAYWLDRISVLPRVVPFPRVSLAASAHVSRQPSFPDGRRSRGHLWALAPGVVRRGFPHSDASHRRTFWNPRVSLRVPLAQACLYLAEHLRWKV